MIEIKNYIGGKLCAARSGSVLTGQNPADGSDIWHCPDSDAADVGAAVQAASEAFGSWKKFDVSKRSSILLRIADIIESKNDELAELESKDTGKPVWLCKEVDIPRSAANFRFFAKAVTQYHSETYDMGQRGFNYTLRDPLGVVGCISPWNLPLYLLSWKIAPALAAGNTVVAKPSEVTPLSAFYLSEICKKAGLPEGVLNICHGFGDKVGQALIDHPGVKAVSFTGGTLTGKKIAAACASRLIPCSLELGGKNAALVYADCEFDHTVNELVRSCFTNQGQICLCTERILVEESIYEKFKTAFISRTSKLKVGDPTCSESDLGALVSGDHTRKVMDWVKTAESEGATILFGGKNVKIEGLVGHFLEPTVIEGLSNACHINQEEVFGPVVTLQKFSNLDESVNLANGTRYGLSATIWSGSLKTCHEVAAKLQVGIVWVNSWLLRDLRTPFGGMKQSGLGREGGRDALDFFTESKNVCIHYDKL